MRQRERRRLTRRARYCIGQARAWRLMDRRAQAAAWLDQAAALRRYMHLA